MPPPSTPWATGQCRWSSAAWVANAPMPCRTGYYETGIIITIMPFFKSWLSLSLFLVLTNTTTTTSSTTTAPTTTRRKWWWWWWWWWTRIVPSKPFKVSPLTLAFFLLQLRSSDNFVAKNSCVRGTLERCQASPSSAWSLTSALRCAIHLHKLTDCWCMLNDPIQMSHVWNLYDNLGYSQYTLQNRQTFQLIHQRQDLFLQGMKSTRQFIHLKTQKWKAISYRRTAWVRCFCLASFS